MTNPTYGGRHRGDGSSGLSGVISSPDDSDSSGGSGGGGGGGIPEPVPYP